jgi:hypothetical protein
MILKIIFMTSKPYKSFQPALLHTTKARSFQRELNILAARNGLAFIISDVLFGQGCQMVYFQPKSQFWVYLGGY